MKTIRRENPVSWVLVNSLGKLKFSKSSYYYLVIVPVIVKALAKVNNPLNLTLGGANIPITIELPFSWYYFYFGAIVIAIGSLIYQLCCPSLIKKYKNYGEFLTSGESDGYLKQIYLKHRVPKPTAFFTEQPYIESKAPIDIDNMDSEPNILYINKKPLKVVDYKQNTKYLEERKNAFNGIYNTVKFHNSYLIYTSFLLYMLGFAAFIWVIIQNIAYVIRHLF